MTDGANDPTGSGGDTGERPRRSWWPALIGAGIVVAVVVAVIVLRADDEALAPTTSTEGSDPQATTPITPEPTATSTPSTTALGPGDVSLVVDGGCITVATIAGSATGCPQDGAELDHLERRTFVADLDGPVVVASGSADPFTDLTATVDDGDFASRCQWDDLADRVPDGGLVEVVVCNDTGVMGATTGRESGEDWTIAYFTLPTPYLPDGTDLGPGTPIDGLSRALAFTADDEAATCSILLLPDRSGWKESCGLAGPSGPVAALVQIDPAGPGPYEILVDDAGLITAARQLDAMAPSSGCSIESANDLVAATLPTSIVTGIGCLDDAASLVTASVLTQEGPPDGLIWSAERDGGGTWTIVDMGTGIDDFAFPIVPAATWSAWPQTTVPRVEAYWRDPIVAIDPQPDIDAFADALLATLAPLAFDPEFPLNERLVAVAPEDLPLVVAQVDLGGDDSVGGAVIHVWLDEVFDDTGPIGWRAAEVLVGNVCLRGIDATSSDLCV